MSQKMVLQHHYGHHMFGDDLAQGAKLSMRSHHRHHPQQLTGLRGTVHEVVEEVEAGVATVEERLADELHGYQRAPPGMEPRALVTVLWGDASADPRPQFTFTCAAAPSVLDTRELGLRGGQQAPPAPPGEVCAFLASFDGEWEHLVPGDAAPAFRPARLLDAGEHTLRVRAVDGRGYVQMTPTLFRFAVDGTDAVAEQREIRWALPEADGGAAGGRIDTETAHDTSATYGEGLSGGGGTGAEQQPADDSGLRAPVPTLQPLPRNRRARQPRTRVPAVATAA